VSFEDGIELSLLGRLQRPLSGPRDVGEASFGEIHADLVNPPEAATMLHSWLWADFSTDFAR
jgi:hypothetical protein